VRSRRARSAMVRVSAFSESIGDRRLTVLTVGYFLVVTFLMALSGAWPTPDKFLIAGLLFALLLARPGTFLRDWSPFVALFLGYEYLRGLIPALGWTVNVHPLICADLFLFGEIPTLTLQRLLFAEAGPRFYDYLFTLTYMAHFALPLGFALLLWVRSRAEFRLFMTALSVLCFAAFFTYLLYPAMPPWMAADQGLIPPVANVMGRTIALFDRGPGLPTFYVLMSPNMVAAMPSLHAAFPAMVYLFALKRYGWKGNVFLLYAAMVWIGIVYTAQHWVVDVFAGMAYALLIFFAVLHFDARRTRRRPSSQAAVLPAQAESTRSV